MNWLKHLFALFRRPSAPDPTPPTLPPLPFSDVDMVIRHNAERARFGKLSPLARDQALSTLADGRAAHAAAAGLTRGHLHDGFFGVAGATASGENAEIGGTDPAFVVAAWMDSEGHRENILDPRYRSMGAARRTSPAGVPYWYCTFSSSLPDTK